MNSFPPPLFAPIRMLRAASLTFLFSLALFPHISQAAEDPIPLIDVVVEKVPPGNAVLSTTTDRKGFIVSRSPLSPGNYRVRDRAGNSANIKHRGGPVRWQLTASSRKGKTIWSLNDASDPL